MFYSIRLVNKVLFKDRLRLMRHAIVQKKNTHAIPQDLALGIENALKRLDKVSVTMPSKDLTDFWVQCVRDTNGEWQDYVNLKSKSGFSYFFGRQNTVDINDVQAISYVKANLRIRRRLYREIPEIPQMSIDDFYHWLRDLHSDMTYKTTYEGNFPRNVPTHTAIVNAEVKPIAKKYRDPYWTGITQGPNFSGIPPEMLPRDVQEGDVISHYYPLLEHKVFYLEAAHKLFCEIVTHSDVGSRDYLKKVACLFQILINLHLFVNINNSLYMNITNAFLEIADINGIEHGILDFVAMRLQPDTFSKYFLDKVAAR